MLSTEQLYTLLAHGLFPKWLSALRQWLGQAPVFHEVRQWGTPPLTPRAPPCTPSHTLAHPCTPPLVPPCAPLHYRAPPYTHRNTLDQVSQWYLGWKELLTQRAPQLLQHDGAREQLNAALAELNAAAATLNEDAPPLPPDGDEPPPPPPPPDEMEHAAPPPPPPRSAAAPGTYGASRWAAGDGEMSLRETLEKLAASRDLVFMPTGARHEGKQVFRFGGVPLFFDPDKGLIFARLDTQGFKPASIQKLLEKAV